MNISASCTFSCKPGLCFRFFCLDVICDDSETISSELSADATANPTNSTSYQCDTFAHFICLKM